MSPWNVVRLADMKAQPWRNGGGVTRELLALPPAGDWTIRISVAEVESDGPFSKFEGVERWFAVLRGAGVDLDIDGERQRVERRGDPLRFDGGSCTHCTLVDGATQDFNLMVRGRRASMRRVAGSATVAGGGGSLVAAYAQSPGTVNGLGLEAGTLAWRVLDVPCDVVLDCVDALWMEVAA